MFVKNIVFKVDRNACYSTYVTLRSKLVRVQTTTSSASLSHSVGHMSLNLLTMYFKIRRRWWKKWLTEFYEINKCNRYKVEEGRLTHEKPYLAFPIYESNKVFFLFFAKVLAPFAAGLLLCMFTWSAFQSAVMPICNLSFLYCHSGSGCWDGVLTMQLCTVNFYMPLPGGSKLSLCRVRFIKIDYGNVN